MTVNLTWRLLDESDSGRSRRSFEELPPILDSIEQLGKVIEIKVKNKCGNSGVCKSGLKATAQFQMGVSNGTNYEWNTIRQVSFGECEIG